MSEEDIKLISDTIRMKVSYEELLKQLTSTDEQVLILPFSNLSLTDIYHFYEYFFKNGVLIDNHKQKSALSLYLQIAIKESDYNILREIIKKNPILNRYESHLLFIIGYAFNSALGQVNKGDANKQLDENFAPALSSVTDYNHLLRAKLDFENIIELFQLLNITYPNPNHVPHCEGDEPDQLKAYILDSVKIKLTSNEGVSKKFFFEKMPNKLTINFLDDVFEFFEFWLNEQGKSIEGWYKERYGFMLPPLDRPENLPYAFCQQFYKFFDERTEFSTTNGFSRNDILSVFVDVYELAGYRFIRTTKYSDKVDLVGNWLYKPVNK